MDVTDTSLTEFRRAIEGRVREQIERHLRINPGGDIGRIVDMQMAQERERLERLIDEADDAPAKTQTLFALIAWLPQFEQQLKSRARRS